MIRRVGSFVEKIDQITITSAEAEHLQKRYAPWLEKALSKMRHSKKTWAIVKQNAEKKKKEEKQIKQDNQK